MEGAGFSQKRAILEQLRQIPAKTKIACEKCIKMSRSSGIRLAVHEKHMYMKASRAIERQSLAAQQMSLHMTNTAFRKLDENPYLELYRKLNLPNAPTLRTDNQALNYILAEMNRTEAFVVTQREEKAKQILDSIPVLQKHLRKYTHPREQDMAWLAHQIPADTQYLLLGEVHKSSLRPSIQQFMKELRTRFADRPIIFLAEFLQEGHSSELDFPEIYHDGRFVSYQPIFDEAKANGISVFGLEPQVVHKYWFFFVAKDNSVHPLWASWFGVKLRNELWLKTIEKYRSENPNALIVIHGGSGHLAYTEPFSIGSELKKRAPTFMASLTLGYPRAGEKSWTEYSAFDYVTKGIFDQRIVQFAPEDAEITGFDVQLKVRAVGEDE